MIIAPSIVKIIEDNQEELADVPLFCFPYSIDPDVQANQVNGIVVLVTEISDNPETAGSNSTVHKLASAQVQLFFPETVHGKVYEGDTSEIRERIEDLLESEGWYCSMSTGIERDPDTAMLFNTSHYKKLYRKRKKNRKGVLNAGN